MGVIMKRYEKNLENLAKTALLSCLSEIPFLKVIDVYEAYRDSDVQANLAVKIEFPDGVKQLIAEIKAGRVEWSPSTRMDRTGSTLSVPVGKASFSVEQLRENILAMVDGILKVRPPAAKGRYLRNISISSTMGPGIKLDTQYLVSLLEQ